MKSVGAKEFRQNLDKILDRVLKGEEIIINHRFKGPVKLSAVYGLDSENQEKLSGLRAFDKAVKKTSPFDSNKSLKELYGESIATKYTK